MLFRNKLSFIIIFFICFFCLMPETYSGWTSINKGIKNTGDISVIAYNPSNSAYILAGANNDGLYESKNSGQSWKKINNPAFENTTFASIVFNPANPNIIYVATRQHGLFQSNDQGLTWKFMLKPDLFFSSFEINKQNPNEIYLVLGGYSDGGVLKSKDSGKAWFKITNTLEKQFSYRKILIDPFNSNHLYLETIGGGDFEGRIYETYDEGAHWQRVLINNMNEPYDIYEAQFIAPGTIYIAGSGFFKSVDYGKTWIPLLKEKSILSFLTNPQKPEEFYLYAYDNGLYHSVDNGAHWELTHPAFYSGRQDFIRLTSDPAHSTVIVYGPDIGILNSSDGKTFAPMDKGIENIEVTALAVDPTNSKRQYVGVKNHGLWIADNSPWQFADKEFTNADIKNILIDPSNPAHVVIIVNTNTANIFTFIYTSNDYGKTWHKAEVEKIDKEEFVPTRLIMNPANPREIYANTKLQGTTELILWKSNDGGQHWFHFSDYKGQWPAGAVYINHFAINPKNPLEMYAGSINETGHMIYKSIDGGKTWQRLSYTFGPDAYNRDYNYTQALAIDPSNPKTVYTATLTGLTPDDLHLFKTTDGGETWAQISNDLPKFDEITSMIIDPANANHIYIATTQGVYVSVNGGINWQPLNDGLSNVNINSLIQSQNKLYAGTKGAGIFVFI